MNLVEAMSAGVAVVTSNRGSLPEVAGDAGVLLDAGDVSAWAATIEKLATDTPWTVELACKGLERAKRFTWERSSAQLRAAYRDAIRRRGDR